MALSQLNSLLFLGSEQRGASGQDAVAALRFAKNATISHGARGCGPTCCHPIHHSRIHPEIEIFMVRIFLLEIPECKCLSVSEVAVKLERYQSSHGSPVKRSPVQPLSDTEMSSHMRKMSMPPLGVTSEV